MIEEVNFRDLVEALPEEFLCPRRAESGIQWPGKDHWDKFKSNGNRVCPHCGSLHPDDLFDLVKQSAEAPEDADYNSVVEVEMSDKSYKIYVQQPGVRNAHEGGIKFYTPHLPRGADGKIAVTEEQQQQFIEAKRRSRVRFEKHLEKSRGT